MADISRVKINGSYRNLKDAQARSALQSKQDTLVSGTNIKTIGGNSILGSGNVTNINDIDFTFDGHLSVLGDVDGSDTNKPDNVAFPNADLDTYLYNTGFYLFNADNGGGSHSISFPARSGVMGLEIDIVDLTSSS